MSPETLSVHEMLITIFLLITAPVSAHMLIKAALHHRLKAVDQTQGEQELKRGQAFASKEGNRSDSTDE